ncbi:MAG: DUF4190 domain-containing protein [Wenzhouxiangella sp.]|nr:DUF4190 domain-containing protein [Wenzhouxiangella sp.]MCH8479433.1 DUF4190 domain-containing protein [Wenzhouxiangella sp.]
MLVIIVLILLVVFLCAAISMMSSSTKANKLAQEKLRRESHDEQTRHLRQRATEDTVFEEKWDIMCRYEQDVRSQVERLEPYGDGALIELKRVFKATEDKTRIAEFTDQIISDIDSGRLALDAAPDQASSGPAALNQTFPESDPNASTTPPAATFSLILGVVSLIVPFVSPIGVILGHITLKKLWTDADQKSARTMTVIGLVLSYLGLVLVVAFLTAGSYL